MRVATRLRSAFALYIVLLLGVLVYHVRTNQRAVKSGRTLADISSRLRVSSAAQLARITQMSGDAEKFLVTHDRGYLERLGEVSQNFGAGLRTLDSASLNGPEDIAFASLAKNWNDAATQMRALSAGSLRQDEMNGPVVIEIQESLERVRNDIRQLALASENAMIQEVHRSEESARSAGRLSWLAAVGALLLSLLLSAVLARSIVNPLGRLADGTREISAGRFGYRLDDRGNDEFAQVARDFNVMTERLDELDRMKRDFVAKVSHDLKTPLTSMRETISVMLDELAGPLSDKQRHLLELNMESGERLSAMLNKLLDLSRIEAGLEPDFQMLDVSALARNSVERVAAAGISRGVRVTYSETEGRVLLRGDESGVAQVIDNLLENAIKFSPTGATVTLGAAEWPSSAYDIALARGETVQRSGMAGGLFLFTVADEGAGIPDSEKEQVFMRFYQTDTGRGIRSRGVGLGLAICKEIVEAHGGAIWVQDNEPRGSVFCVLLPGAVKASEAVTAAVGLVVS